MTITDRLAPSRIRLRPTCANQTGDTASRIQDGPSTSADMKARLRAPAAASIAAVELASATFALACAVIAATTASV